MDNTSPIPSLTGLRFFAAAFVAVAHFNGSAKVTLWGYPIETAPLGMSMFFCLSGFIIHYVYGSTFSSNWGPNTIRFAFARFSRLYPLFAAFIFYGLIFYPTLPPAFADPRVAVSYLTLTGTWWYWHSSGQTLIELPSGISWSIATEWFFYCAYAAVLYRISRITSLRVCIGSLLGLSVLAYGLLLLFYATSDTWEPMVLSALPGAIAYKTDFGNSFFRWLFYVSPYFRILEFIGGCLTCQVFFILRKNHIGWRSPEAIFWVGAAWIALTFGLFTYMDSESGHWLMVSSRFFLFVHFLHMTFLFAPGLFLIFLGLALDCAAARYVFGGASLVYLGEISYSIYLGHPFVGGFAYVSAEFENKEIGLMIDIFLACVIAVGLYTLIEMPAKTALRNWYDRFRRTVSPAITS